MAGPKVLLVDSKRQKVKERSGTIEQLGYTCISASDGSAAARTIEKEHPDIILTNENLPVGDVFAVLDAAMAGESEIPVVIFTNNGKSENAVQAMKRGIFNLVNRPDSLEKLGDVLDKTVENNKLRCESSNVMFQMKRNRYWGELVFKSSIMKQIMHNIVKLSKSNANVMIFGESGTGKELIARSVHELGKDKSSPFIPLDCVALPASLIESELFGFEKGSFTGAAQKKIGIIELAAGGTLFLDEITELDLQLQAKLLRVIQEHKFRRIGGKEFINVKFRIISATNRDPEKAVSSGRLREDLFYRLNVVPVYVPPLRDRAEDIPLLVNHFIDKYKQSSRRPVLGISGNALASLCKYPWPGNVRELENIIQRIISLIEHDYIRLEDIPDKVRSYSDNGTDFDGTTKLYKKCKQEKINQFGRQYLIKMLKDNHCNISQMARSSGLSRTSLYRMMKKYHINRNKFL